MALSNYTALLTSQHRSKPKFAAWVEAITAPLAENVETMRQLYSAFDLDTARGAQLDTIGVWVGADRRVLTPLNIFFSFDAPGLGFDQGVWRGPYETNTGVTRLDDETYRALIRVKVAANMWDGSLSTYQELMQLALPPANTFYAVDNQDMTITVHVTGPALSAPLSALLQTGALSTIRPAGVSIAGYVLP